jgi:hypothetical protein
LLAHVAPLLPTFDVHIICFNLSAQLRAPSFALGVEGLPVRPSHAPRSLSRHANFFSDRPGGSPLVHLSREVDPAPQAYVGGFQKRTRRER